jgi:DNA-binding transcriptional ArsR family regulator
MEMLDRQEAERYAAWFRALADPTRIQVVTLLARRRQPMTVGEIVFESGLGQSTVSHHLKALSAVRFVLCEQAGTARWYRINSACVECFPTAADIVMGREVPEPPDRDGPRRRRNKPRSGRGVRSRRPGGVTVGVVSTSSTTVERRPR